MRKFIRYQLELKGTSEEDLTETFSAKLNSDCDNRTGIYDRKFGDVCEVMATEYSGELVLCGCIVANTKKECNAAYTLLKGEIKRTFPTCKKINEMLKAEGDKIY
jgi:hypothetical protein